MRRMKHKRHSRRPVLEQLEQMLLLSTTPLQGGTPNYFGPEPNWAYSPQPTTNVAPVTVGNPLVARVAATDTASNVLVVDTVLPAGTLTDIQTYAQPGS